MSWRAASARHREAVAPPRQGIDRLRGGEARLEDEAQQGLGISRRRRSEEAAVAARRPRSGPDPGPARRPTTVTCRREPRTAMSRPRPRTSGLPAARRISGGCQPWLRALRRAWSSGSFRACEQYRARPGRSRPRRPISTSRPCSRAVSRSDAGEGAEDRLGGDQGEALGRRADPDAAPSRARVASAWRRDRSATSRAKLPSGPPARAFGPPASAPAASASAPVRRSRARRARRARPSAAGA